MLGPRVGSGPAIDYLNGELVNAGHEAGVATPVNRAVCELVHAFAAGDEVRGTRTSKRC